MKMARQYSVVIPLYNKERTINETIESVLKQTYKPSQIIVVDDYSTDNSYSTVIGTFRKRVTLLKNDRNIGKASTINWAIQNKVTSPFVLILDADTFLDKDFVKEAMKGFKHRRVKGVCGQVFPSKIETFIEKVRAVEYIQCPLVRGIQNKIKGTWVLSGCASLWRTFFIEKHPYSSNTLVEDMDLSWICQGTRDYKRRPFEVSFIGNARCFSEEPKTFKGLVYQLHRWYSNRNVIKRRFTKVRRGLKLLSGVVVGAFLAQIIGLVFALFTKNFLWILTWHLIWTVTWLGLILIQNRKFKVSYKTLFIGSIGFYGYIWLCFFLYIKCLIKPKRKW